MSKWAAVSQLSQNAYEEEAASIPGGLWTSQQLLQFFNNLFSENPNPTLPSPTGSVANANAGPGQVVVPDSGASATPSTPAAASTPSLPDTTPTTAGTSTSPVIDYNWTTYSPSTLYLDPNQTPNSTTIVSSQDLYLSNQFDPYNNYGMQGYTRANMSVRVNSNGAPAIYSFEFLVGPNAMTEQITNNVSPVQTGNGYFILKCGPGLTQLGISGYFLETSIADERRVFLEKYYRSYLVDNINAFHDYFYDSSLTLTLAGYDYKGIITNLQITKNANTMFTFAYNMSLMITSQTPNSAVKSLTPQVENTLVTYSGSSTPTYSSMPAGTDLIVTYYGNSTPVYSYSSLGTNMQNLLTSGSSTN